MKIQKTILNLWIKRTIQKYKEKVKCIIDQYNNYTVKQINRTVILVYGLMIKLE